MIAIWLNFFFFFFCLFASEFPKITLTHMRVSLFVCFGVTSVLSLLWRTRTPHWLNPPGQVWQSALASYPPWLATSWLAAPSGWLTPSPTTTTHPLADPPPPPPLPGMITWWMVGTLGLYADEAYLCIFSGWWCRSCRNCVRDPDWTVRDSTCPQSTFPTRTRYWLLRLACASAFISQLWKCVQQ